MSHGDLVGTLKALTEKYVDSAKGVQISQVFIFTVKTSRGSEKFNQTTGVQSYVYSSEERGTYLGPQALTHSLNKHSVPTLIERFGDSD